MYNPFSTELNGSKKSVKLQLNWQCKVGFLLNDSCNVIVSCSTMNLNQLSSITVD